MDTCSTEISRNLTTNFLRYSNLVVIVYSIDNKESFIHVKSWLDFAKTYCEKDCKYFLIGNKIDLESERKVSREDGEKFAKENNFDFFDECSAKLGINTQNILIKAAKILSSPLFFEKQIHQLKKIQKKIKLMKYISY